MSQTCAICLMIEGQEGVAWEDWVALAQACERLGFEALFRSDHYLSRRRAAASAARSTRGARSAALGRDHLDGCGFGTLVSPATFRHPSVLAKAVVTADHISGGRVELGIGTGWLEAEHTAYGFPFPPMGERMDGSVRAARDHPPPMDRTYVRLRRRALPDRGARRAAEAGAAPAPAADRRRGRGPALGAARRALGGRVQHGLRRRPEQARERRRAARRGVRAARAATRRTLRFSMMNGFLVGADRDDLRDRARRLAEWRGETDRAAADLDGWIAERRSRGSSGRRRRSSRACASTRPPGSSA